MKVKEAESIFIYKIKNLVNNKIYIGSTTDPERRKKEHFGSATWNVQSYNYPLQKAIRKYGKENFIFSIVEKCDIESCPERERYYIEYYNSLTNSGWGYNQTLETKCALRDKNIQKRNIERTGKKCALVDKDNKIIQVFESYHDASRQVLNMNEASNIREICQGKCKSYKGKIFRDIDKNGKVIIPEIIVRELKHSVVGISVFDLEDKIYFESISDAARELKIDRSSIIKSVQGNKRYSQVGKRIWRTYENGKIINNNIPIQEVYEQYRRKYVFYENEWQLVTNVSKKLGLNYATVSARIRNGKTANEALGLQEVM